MTASVPLTAVQITDANLLSWVDVIKGAELKQEVVVGEGRLCVGYAAVVT